MSCPVGSSNKNDFDIAGGSGTGSQVGYKPMPAMLMTGDYLLEALRQSMTGITILPPIKDGLSSCIFVGWNTFNEKFLNR